MEQVDVIAAYPNSPWEVTVYMEQPSCYEEAGKSASNFVCKLNKSLYRYKQSGRNWINHLHDCLTVLGCSQCVAEPCVDLQEGGHNNKCICRRYDDIGDKEKIEEFKNDLGEFIKIKDLGAMSVLWSLRVNRLAMSSLVVDQKDYIQNVLSEFNMSECKGICQALLKLVQ